MLAHPIHIALSILAIVRGSSSASIADREAIITAVEVQIDHPIDINTQITYTKDTRVNGFPPEIASLIETTSPNTGLHSLDATLTDPQLVICNQQNCAGFCGSIDMILVPTSVCFTSSLTFLSGMISVTGSTIPTSPKAIIAQPGCTSPFQLTTANTCTDFLINGLPGFFDTFVFVSS